MLGAVCTVGMMGQSLADMDSPRSETGHDSTGINACINSMELRNNLCLLQRKGSYGIFLLRQCTVVRSHSIVPRLYD